MVGELPVVSPPVRRRVNILELGVDQLQLTGLVQTLPLVSQTEPVVVVVYRHPQRGPVEKGLSALIRHSGAETLETAGRVEVVETEGAGLALITVPALNILQAVAAPGHGTVG